MRWSKPSLSAQPPAYALRNALRGSWGSASRGDNGLQRCGALAARSRNVVSAWLPVLGPAQAVVRTFCKRLGPAQRVVRTFCKRLGPAQAVVRTFCKRLGPAQRVVRTFCKRRLPALTLCGGRAQGQRARNGLAERFARHIWRVEPLCGRSAARPKPARFGETPPAKPQTGAGCGIAPAPGFEACVHQLTNCRREHLVFMPAGK